MIEDTAPYWIIIFYYALLYSLYGFIVFLVVTTATVFILRELNYWLNLGLPSSPFYYIYK